MRRSGATYDLVLDKPAELELAQVIRVETVGIRADLARPLDDKRKSVQEREEHCRTGNQGQVFPWKRGPETRRDETRRRRSRDLRKRNESH